MRSARSALAACVVAVLACDRPSRLPDSDAPRVLAQLPAPGASDVAVRAPIRATFSEPIDPATVSDTTVLFTGPGGVALSKVLRLSADALVLTVEPVTTPAAPSSVTVTLTDGLRDVSGNRLVPPAPWSFSYPVWLELGPGLSLDPGQRGAEAPQVAVAPGDRVWAAWRQVGPAAGSPPVATSEIRVAAWDGSVWVSAGGILNFDPTRGSSRPALAIEEGTGRPVVAWDESIGTTGSASGLYAKRWSGTSWEQLGNVLNTDPGQEVYHRMLASGPGVLVAAWEETTAAGGIHVYARRWTGTAWETVGGGPATSDAEAALGGGLLFGLGVDGQGRVWVSFEMQGAAVVRIADAGAWTSAGSSIPGTGGRLAVRGSAASLVVEEPLACASGEPCVELRVRSWTGSGWGPGQPVANAFRVGAFNGAGIGLAPDGEAVVAYQQEEELAGGWGELFRIASWNGSTWAPLGDALLGGSGVSFSYDPTIAFDSQGAVFVANEAWLPSPAVGDAHVFQLNR